MRVLLDTHTFLWLIADRDRIEREALAILTDSGNEVFYSAVLSWEICVKRATGRLQFEGSPCARARSIGLTELSIAAEHSEASAALPLHHGDPFDRLLIAQAQIEGLVLATRDSAIDRYGIRLLQI